MVFREISKTTDASVILPVFSQYARTFLRKSNEYAINTLYHKCTDFVSFNYISIATNFILDNVTDFQHDFQTEYMEDSKHNTREFDSLKPPKVSQTLM
ncbi:hypothetical protein CWM22_01320 [Streptococcus suis]|nr:hypothetical protein CWM22_01320 [Streptococcus suis]